MPTTAAMPRAALHQEQIIQAATALVNEGGIERPTMRRLGITAAALYRHIKCRHDLLLLAADTVRGQTPLPALDSLEWPDLFHCAPTAEDAPFLPELTATAAHRPGFGLHSTFSRSRGRLTAERIQAEAGPITPPTRTSSSAAPPR